MPPMAARTARLAALLAAALLAGALAACSPQAAGPSTPPAATPESTPAPTDVAPPPPTAPPASAPSDAPTTEPTPDPAAAAAAALAAKPWATFPLTDVRTGEAFTVADLAGRVVFLETMAIWCTKCRAQQHEATTAMADLDPERVVWLALDVDPAESAPDLARYADDEGFPHRYAVASAEVSRALAAEFGDQVLNPPSVPILVIAADGTVEAGFGHRDVAAIVATARAAGA